MLEGSAPGPCAEACCWQSQLPKARSAAGSGGAPGPSSQLHAGKPCRAGFEA
jgi:hypothetical protein